MRPSSEISLLYHGRDGKDDTDLMSMDDFEKAMGEKNKVVDAGAAVHHQETALTRTLIPG